MSASVWIPCAGATSPLLCCLRSINTDLDDLVGSITRIGWLADVIVMTNGNTEMNVYCPRCAPVYKAIRAEGLTARTVKLARDAVEVELHGTRYALNGQAGECSRDMLAWTQDMYVLADEKG